MEICTDEITKINIVFFKKTLVDSIYADRDGKYQYIK